MSLATGGPPPVRLRSQSAEDTRALGAALAAALRPGDVVLLAGDLGAGKTTLAQGIGVGLGVADRLTSPTFTLVRAYPCPAPVESVTAARSGTGFGSGNRRAIRTLLHADLYRLENLAEVADLAIAELVEDDAVAVVEWGDVAGPVLGGDAMTVRLAEGAVEDERSVTITAADRSAARHKELGHLLAQWVAP